MCVSVHMPQKNISTFLYHSPPHPFKRGSSPANKLAGHPAHNRPLTPSLNAWVTGTHSHAWLFI